MKIKKCRRRKFTYKNLPDSGSFYSGVSSRIEKIQLLLYTELELDYLEGYTYYSPILHNIITYNRCFYSLAKEGELIAAYPLIRLQAENLKVLVAESLYPNRILPAIFGKGKELTDIITVPLKSERVH